MSPLPFIQRIPARKLLYSMVEEERGVECGSIQRVFLKVSERVIKNFLGSISAICLSIFATGDRSR